MLLTFATAEERAEQHAHPKPRLVGVVRVICGNSHCHRASRVHVRLAVPAVLDFRVRTWNADRCSAHPATSGFEQKPNHAIFGPVRGSWRAFRFLA